MNVDALLDQVKHFRKRNPLILDDLNKLIERYDMNEDCDEHINDIKNAIASLCEERSYLKDLMEAISIKKKSRINIINNTKEHTKKEKKETVSIVNKQNSNTIKELKHQIGCLLKENEATEKKEEILKEENDKLTEKSNYAKAMWPELSDMMGDSMIRKSQMKIAVNNTRCRTIEAQERKVQLEEEVEETRLDVEDYNNYCRVQCDKIKDDSDKWKGKIAKQEIETAESKAVVDSLAEDIKAMNREIVKERQKLNIEQGIVHRLNERRNKLWDEWNEDQRNVAKAKKENAELELHYRGLKEYYEGKCKTLAESTKAIVEESKQVFEEQENLKIESNYTKQQLTRKRSQEGALLESRNAQRSALLESNNLVNMVMGELGAVRSEKEKVKRGILKVKDERHQIDMSYKRQIEKLREEYKEEKEAKKFLKEEYEDSCRQLQECFDSTDLECAEMTVKTKEYEMKIKTLTDEKNKLIELMNQNEDKLTTFEPSYTEIETKLRNLEESTNYEIERLNSSIKTLKKDVFEKGVFFDKRLPLYRQLKDEYESTKDEFHEKRDLVVSGDRRLKDLQTANEKTKLAIKKQEAMTNDLKGELELMNKDLLENMNFYRTDVNLLNESVHSNMKDHVAISNNNFTMAEMCNEKESIIGDYARTMLHTCEMIEHLRDKFYQLQNRLLVLLKEGKELEAMQGEEDRDIFNALQDRMDFNKTRNNVVSHVSVKMDQIVHAMNKL